MEPFNLKDDIIVAHLGGTIWRYSFCCIGRLAASETYYPGAISRLEQALGRTYFQASLLSHSCEPIEDGWLVTLDVLVPLLEFEIDYRAVCALRIPIGSIPTPEDNAAMRAAGIPERIVHVFGGMLRKFVVTQVPPYLAEEKP